MEILGPGRRTGLAVVLLLTAAGLLRAGADGAALDEYQVKAAFLFNFAKFVDWAPDAAKGSADPIVLCIVGDNPFGSALDAVSGKRVGNKTFVVRETSAIPSPEQCQIVFVAASEHKRTRAVLDHLKGSGVLTVGETDDFLSNGGVVAFKVKDDRVRFEINAAAAEASKLHISSKLLSLGENARR